MKKSLFLMLTLVIILILQAGCTKAIRYSHDEIKDFPPSVQEHIKKGEVAVGMSKLQVRFSWGGPVIVNVLPPGEEGQERVEWIYRRLRIFKTQLIFTNDKLTEIISTVPVIAK